MGGSSVNDHGKFVYDNYISDIPFYDQKNFIPYIKEIVKIYSIDAIYPTMDTVITILSQHEKDIECKIISSPSETTEICNSKRKTYEVLKNIIIVPKTFSKISEICSYPVFMKPEIGYGSRGAKKIESELQAKEHFENYPNCIISEYLSGKEYTIDCFTNKNRKLIFTGVRERVRIMNGISVNTSEVFQKNDNFKTIAEKINKTLNFNGAWFFQLKENENNQLVLLEIACRLGGSSALFRNKGINFAMLSLFNSFGYDVNIIENNFNIEMDRALDNKYKIDIKFDKVYIDFDDCIILNENKINTQLIQLIYQFINEQKKIILITKHNKNIYQTLTEYRLQSLFDEIIHLKIEDQKYKFINGDSIFIDDSFAERQKVYYNLGIPVFSPDAVESLLK